MNLRPYLDENGISPAEFARRIRVELASVHRYLNGERIPRLDILERIVHATDGAVQANDFFASAQARQTMMQEAR
jgi:transcriptional regulator with XRE-family HTH domain